MEWTAAADAPDLPGARDIHLWFADLRLLDASLPAAAALLSAPERERAARFVFPIHRDRFLLKRGWMRVILGRYSGMAPECLQFQEAAAGKPFLEGGPRFNLSDSGDYVALGITRDAELGVDIEQVREIADALAIAERFFSPVERDALASVAPDETAAAFLTCWTRKESVLKALGSGLSLPVDSFDVSLLPREPAKLLDIRDAAGENPTEWSLYDLRPAPDCVGAVAIRGHGWELTGYRFAGPIA